MHNNPINFNDPSGHEPKYGEGACYEIDCKNANGTLVKDGNGKGGAPKVGKHDDFVEDIRDEIFYNPNFGGSSSGCNTLILTNTNGNPCHHNSNPPAPICPIFTNCSQQEQWNYALRFQYPVQAPWNPVVNFSNRSVMGGDFYPGSDLYRLGAIYVNMDDATITNLTYPSHIFYNGKIDRTISDGYVLTEGQGINNNYLIAAANQYIGPMIFKFVDAEMLVFSTADQISDGLLVELMDAIP